MAKQSAADVLRRIAADLDRTGFMLAAKCHFDGAVRLFMRAEESRRIAIVAEQFDLLLWRD